MLFDKIRPKSYYESLILVIGQEKHILFLNTSLSKSIHRDLTLHIRYSLWILRICWTPGCWVTNGRFFFLQKLVKYNIFWHWIRIIYIFLSIDSFISFLRGQSRYMIFFKWKWILTAAEKKLLIVAYTF